MMVCPEPFAYDWHHLVTVRSEQYGFGCEWCARVLGPWSDHDKWSVDQYDKDDPIQFRFKFSDDAMMFKLVFSEHATQFGQEK